MFRVANTDFQFNLLRQQTHGKLFVSVISDRSKVIPKGTDYLSFGLFRVGQPLNIFLDCETNWAKRLPRFRGWEKIEAQCPLMGG
ncbi:MAG: hypothetical protein ACOY16_00035 [Chloroflexota bacterium]